MEDWDSKAIIELLIDSENSKVICARAQKGFIDFLFSLLKLPLGTVLKLFSPQSKIGCLGKLYQSVHNLGEGYFVSKRAKSSVLSPNFFISDLGTPLHLGTTAIEEPTYYLCNSCKGKVTTVRNIICPNCKQVMTDKVDYVVPSASHSSGSRTEEDGGESTEGFVKESIFFTITDDLIVTPRCDVSIRKIIKDYVSDYDAESEKIVRKKVVVGVKEGLAILEASLESSTVLTDVFSSALISPKKKEKDS